MSGMRSLEYLQKSHDALSSAIEDPDACQYEVRSAAIDICDALNFYWSDIHVTDLLDRRLVIDNVDLRLLEYQRTCLNRYYDKLIASEGSVALNEQELRSLVGLLHMLDDWSDIQQQGSNA